MDHLPAADVQAHVVDGAGGGAEEDQVVGTSMEAPAGTAAKREPSSATRVTGNRHDFLMKRAPWTSGSAEPLQHLMVAPDRRLAAKPRHPPKAAGANRP
jgi:hypothetical protein